MGNQFDSDQVLNKQNIISLFDFKNRKRANTNVIIDTEKDSQLKNLPSFTPNVINNFNLQ